MKGFEFQAEEFLLSCIENEESLKVISAVKLQEGHSILGKLIWKLRVGKTGGGDWRSMA